MSKNGVIIDLKGGLRLSSPVLHRVCHKFKTGSPGILQELLV